MMKTRYLSALILGVFAAGMTVGAFAKMPPEKDDYQAQIARIRAEYASLHYTAQCNIVDYVHDKLGWRDGEFKIKYSHEYSDSVYFTLWNVSVEESLYDPILKTALNVPGDYFIKIDPTTNAIVWVKEEQ